VEIKRTKNKRTKFERNQSKKEEKKEKEQGAGENKKREKRFCFFFLRPSPLASLSLKQKKTLKFIFSFFLSPFSLKSPPNKKLVQNDPVADDLVV
jgi:hypothetical protein